MARDEFGILQSFPLKIKVLDDFKERGALGGSGSC